MTTEKNENLDLAEGVVDFKLLLLNRLLKFTRLHKVSSIENNIFEPQFLLETLITEVELLREEQKAGQRAICSLKAEFPKIVRNEFNRCLKGGL